MKTNLKLVAGGVAGLLTAFGLMAGLLFWASASDAPAEPQAQAPDPVPVPALEQELANTASPAVPEPTVEEVEEAPAPPSYEPELAGGAIRVRRLVVSTGVRAHEPIGATNVVAVGAQPRVYAFVDAINATDEPVALDVTFEPTSGESTGHVSLDIPPNVRRFRTWAYTRHIYEPGRWEVVVRGPDGRVIARRPFDVTD